MGFFDSPPAGVRFESADIDEFPHLKRMSTGWNFPQNTVGNIRELALAAVADLALANPLVKYGIEASIARLQGDRGLKLTPMLNGDLLGITEQEAEDLGEAFEDLWDSWANSTDASTSGQQDFASTIETAARRSFSTGEILLSVDHVAEPGRRFATGVKSLDSNRISRFSTFDKQPPAGHRVLQGVELNNATDKVTAVYLRDRLEQLGQQQYEVYQGLGNRYPIETAWGRPLIIFSIIERLGPGVVRGTSPILGAVERAIMAEKLEVATLDQAVEVLKVAWVIYSDMSDVEKAAAMDPTRAGEMNKAFLGRLNAHFKDMPWKMPEGTRVTFLPQGAKMTTTSPQIQGNSIDAILRRLNIEMARALALSYSDLTGDYSQETYASTRMAGLDPWAIVYQRRRSFLAPVYQQAYSAVLEEAIMRGMVKLPTKAAPFLTARKAWTAARWTGPVRPSADPLKDAQARDIALANGTSSLAEVGREAGWDWREMLEQRAREKAYAAKFGLSLYEVQPMARPIMETQDRKDA